MLKKNEEYVVDIIDNGFQGEGIAKIEGMPIFINTAIKGEKVKIKILKVLKNFAYGKLIEIIEKSNERVEPDCITYTKCGGCNLRHLKYEETLKIKKAIVQNCLYKALKMELNVEDVIGMENPYHYRNKLQYPVGENSEGKSIMGVFSARTHNIIPTDNCFIQNKKSEEIAKYIFEFVKQNNITTYNEETLKGTLRHIIIRIGIKTNEILVTLVINEDKLKDEEELAKYITNKYPEVKTIVKNYNTKNTNVILGNKTKILYGEGFIYDILGNYKFKISPLSFYQVNPVQTEVLYNTAIELGEFSNNNLNNIALDLYCGIGTIGIFASKYFSKVYGIEIVEDAIKDAKENAKINKIKNTEFYAGDVEKILPKLIEKDNIRPNVVFVDPPRKGLDENTISLLLNLKPEKIIYISCNPATLARDLEKLGKDYNISKIQPVDMFPYTSHVECVVVMGIKENS